MPSMLRSPTGEKQVTKVGDYTGGKSQKMGIGGIILEDASHSGSQSTMWTTSKITPSDPCPLAFMLLCVCVRVCGLRTSF